MRIQNLKSRIQNPQLFPLRLALGILLLALSLVSAQAVAGPEDNDFGSPTIGAPTRMHGGRPATGGQDALPWQYEANHPTGVSRTAGVFDDAGNFHVVCGNSNIFYSDPYDEIWNPLTNTWTRGLTHPSGIYGVHNHDVAKLGNTIYVGGGNQGPSGFYNNLTAIDLGANQWTVRTSMPLNSLRNYAFAAAGGSLFCFGGYTASVLNTNYRYDPGSNTWSARAPMPGARRCMTACVIGDTIHVFGGMTANDNNSTMDNHWKYDWVTNQWVTGTPLPAALGWARAVVVTDPDSGPMIYVTGGVSAGTTVNTVYRYSPRSDGWATESPLLTATRSHAADVQGNRIVVCGGYNAGILRITEQAVISHVDVQTLSIDAPTGIVVRGSVTPPLATVRNNSTTAQTFNVRFNIGDGYTDTQSVTVPPNSQQQVTFAGWTANTPGFFTTRCSTMLADDNDPANDQATDSVIVRGQDFQVMSIDAPTGTVTEGETIPPKATVRNNGTSPLSFFARFEITGGYVDSQNARVPPGSRMQVRFSNWIAGPVGRQATKCTLLIADENPNDNRLTDSVHVSAQMIDVGTDAINRPTGTVDSGATVTPEAVVHNYGMQNADFTVMFRIGTQYTSSQPVTGLTPGATTTLDFAPWTATEVGLLAVKCTTMLTGDQNPTNDAQAGIVQVRVNGGDVGTVSISAPTGIMDSGQSVEPQATVHNFGTVSATFDVRLTVGSSYADVQTVTNLAPGADQPVNFLNWTALERGNLLVQCSTMLAGDLNPGNDRQAASVTVNVHDVGVQAITEPVGNIPPSIITPTATVRNYGTTPDPVTVVFLIPEVGYLSVRDFPGGLPAGVDSSIQFDDWTATEGVYTAVCSTYSATDQNPANDTMHRIFSVGVGDVGVTQILAPTGSIDSSATVTPQAKVHNYGTTAVSFWAFFLIDNGQDAVVYRDSQVVQALASGADAVKSFVNWSRPHPLGPYTTRCSTYLNGDSDHSNDTMSGTFTVAYVPPQPESGWVARTPLPIGSKKKGAKDGGALAYGKSGDSAFVYALKGNSRLEFYSYDVAANEWATRESVPAFGRSAKKKAVKKGGTLAGADGSLYATKGGGTLDFWRYAPSVTSYPWRQMADVPAGNKTVKEGTGAAVVPLNDTTYIYLLKGSGTEEFYRYNVTSNAWQTMTSAPTGLSNKPYKNGSTITYDGVGTIYAVKATYDEFYSYRVDSDKWTTLKPWPFVGAGNKKKKVKGGCGLTFYNGRVYGMKGDNTFEFWSYTADSDQWTQLADVPLGAGKKVNGGGAMVLGGYRLYALKGNGTLEFYSYTPVMAAGPQLSAGGSDNALSNSELGARNSGLAISPNPFTNATTISYSIPKAGDVRLKLYDVTGKLVNTLVSGYHNAGTSSFLVPRSSLSSGVYLLKLETGTATATAKLIIE